MPIVSESLIDEWYKENSKIYQLYKYSYTNPLVSKEFNKPGASVCPYFWRAIFIGLIWYKCLCVPLSKILGVVGEVISSLGRMLDKRLAGVVNKLTSVVDKFPHITTYIKYISGSVVYCFILVGCFIIGEILRGLLYWLGMGILSLWNMFMTSLPTIGTWGSYILVFAVLPIYIFYLYIKLKLDHENEKANEPITRDRLIQLIAECLWWDEIAYEYKQKMSVYFYKKFKKTFNNNSQFDYNGDAIAFAEYAIDKSLGYIFYLIVRKNIKIDKRLLVLPNRLFEERLGPNRIDAVEVALSEIWQISDINSNYFRSNMHKSVKKISTMYDPETSHYISLKPLFKSIDYMELVRDVKQLIPEFHSQHTNDRPSKIDEMFAKFIEALIKPFKILWKFIVTFFVYLAVLAKSKKEGLCPYKEFKTSS